MKPYRSCYFLESGIGLVTDGIVFCCDRESPASVPIMENACKTVDVFLETRERVIRENQGAHPLCAGCNLFQQYEKTNGEIKFINFAVTHYCQFACTYCDLQHSMAKNKNRPENYDSIEIAEELKRRGLLSKNLVVVCAPGEIAVHPERDKYYDFIEENAELSFFFSNAGRFDPRLAHILSLSPRNDMTVSIDAGTEETFRRIRGVNLFKQVISNLAEYRKYTSQIYLKYILLDDNLDDKDLDGFVQICSDLKTPKMLIASDMRKSWSERNQEGQKAFEENIVSAAVKLAAGAIRANLYFAFEDLMGTENLKEIYRRLAELPEVISAERQLDEALAAEKLICYGAGGNCEKALFEMSGLGLRGPDMIWDIKAKPGQTFCAGGHEYPVCLPDFDLLSGGGLRCIQHYYQPRHKSAA